MIFSSMTMGDSISALAARVPQTSEGHERDKPSLKDNHHIALSAMDGRQLRG